MLLVARVPQNIVGWMFLAIGIFGGANSALDGYAGYALYTRPGVAGGVAAAWMLNWVWVPLVGVAGICFPLVFPDGHTLSSAWRRVLNAGVAITLIGTLVIAFRPGPLDPFEAIQNPLAWSGLPSNFVDAMLIPIPVLAAVALASQFVRYRRATADQRHQIKWVAMAAAILAVLFAAVTVAELRTTSAGFPQPLATAFFLSFAVLPVTTAIAVLRYRLYDVDAIINRMFVYVPLTAILAGLYVSMSGFLRAILTNLTDAGSEAAIAMSTLMIVAIFTPAKNQLQTIVDRRFKEAPDPQKALRGLTDQARSFADLADRKVLLLRYLDALTAAFNSSGASVELVDRSGASMRIE